MVRHLFEDFLVNSDSYHACERFWEQLTSEIVSREARSSEWKRWIPRSFANGTPMELDGNPIWDGRSDELDRAYRLIQMPPTEDRLELGTWLNHNDSETPELPGDELVIVLALSEESAELASDMLRKWMDPSTTPEVMSRYTTEVLARIAGPTK